MIWYLLSLIPSVGTAGKSLVLHFFTNVEYRFFFPGTWVEMSVGCSEHLGWVRAQGCAGWGGTGAALTLTPVLCWWDAQPRPEAAEGSSKSGTAWFLQKAWPCCSAPCWFDNNRVFIDKRPCDPNCVRIKPHSDKASSVLQPNLTNGASSSEGIKEQNSCLDGGSADH